jgi:hypothetical protein
MPRENYLQVDKGILWVSFHPNIVLYKTARHSVVRGVLFHSIFSLNYQTQWFLILTYLLSYDYINVP